VSPAPTSMISMDATRFRSAAEVLREASALTGAPRGGGGHSRSKSMAALHYALPAAKDFEAPAGVVTRDQGAGPGAGPGASSGSGRRASLLAARVVREV